MLSIFKVKQIDEIWLGSGARETKILFGQEKTYPPKKV